MEHKLPQLPFEKNALAPYISAETIEYHYGKHHRAYVDNLNRLIVGTEFENMPLEEIIRKSSGGIFNNAAQVWNHTFYWNCLTSSGKGKPEGDLSQLIEKQFGSFSNFQEKFTSVSMSLFGSGWTWLIYNEDGSLTIEPMSNAGTPVKDSRKPLLTCDVWEHAYYIDYRNARAKYMEAYWKMANWEFAAQNLIKMASIKGTK